jgi:hypothetical protein
MPISAGASCSVILARTKVGNRKARPGSQDNQNVHRILTARFRKQSRVSCLGKVSKVLKVSERDGADSSDISNRTTLADRPNHLGI